MDEYLVAHENVWPDMLDALRAAGVRNYTIFRADNDVFGYFEADDLDAASAYMAAQDVNTRWQEAMSPLVENPVKGGAPPSLEAVFRLD
jgi:L-rhamnose mutarotase